MPTTNDGCVSFKAAPPTPCRPKSPAQPKLAEESIAPPLPAHRSHYLTRSRPAFSSTLTTIALYDSSLRWFEACSCEPASRGRPLMSHAPRLLWKRLNHSSSFAPSWCTLVQVPFVATRRGPTANAVGIFPTEFLRPAADTFMAHVNAPSGKHLLNHPKAQREPKIG